MTHPIFNVSQPLSHDTLDGSFPVKRESNMGQGLGDIAKPPFFLNGSEVIVSDTACKYEEDVQFRFPRSKCKRIRRKWAKRADNYRLVKKERAFIFSGKLYMSESAWMNILNAKVR